MNSLQKLQPIELQLTMAELTCLSLDTNAQHRIPCLSKNWTPPSFEAAMSRFNQIAQLAQTQDHHPEVLSSHTHLQVRIWTHEVAGLNHKDFTLAKAIDQLSIAA
jgi:pterin-4a-carbinolamine dehydratase